MFLLDIFLFAKCQIVNNNSTRVYLISFRYISLGVAGESGSETRQGRAATYEQPTITP
jgi:hypothetical protein